MDNTIMFNSLQDSNIRLFCSKCGQELTYNPQRYSIVGHDTFISRFHNKVISYNLYGTICCRVKMFSSIDIHWDYGERNPIGERIEHTDLAKLVKLCCMIGKSPFAIRRGTTGYYFQVRAKRHLDALHILFKDQISTL